MKKLVLALFFFAALSFEAFAQTPQPVQSATQNQEIQILKAQLESTQKYQEQFISIVLWSLGSVIAMTLGLAAFNWFSNKNSFEREVKALSHESQLQYKELISQTKSEIESLSKNLEASLVLRLDEIKVNILKEVGKKVEAQAKLIETYKKDILNLEYVIVQREAEEAAKEKRYEWSNYKYCELICLSLALGSDEYQVGEILDGIRKNLSQANIRISSDDVTNTVETMRKLPKRYEAAAESIISIVKGLHII